jgi:hypothetical protein
MQYLLVSRLTEEGDRRDVIIEPVDLEPEDFFKGTIEASSWKEARLSLDTPSKTYLTRDFT